MNRFTKEHTSVLKGIAIIFLLIHHGWQATDYTFLIGGRDLISNLQSFAKICVAIFVILSGYGLYMSYEKYRPKHIKDRLWFVSRHLLKVYLTFWLVYIVGVLIIGNMIGNVNDVYAGHPLYYMLLDSMGLSYFTQSPKYVNSWWYISATLIYYIAFPFLYELIKRLKKYNYLLMLILAGALFIPGPWGSISIYFVFFLFGMIFAERKVIDKISSWKQEYFAVRIIKILIYVAGFIAVTVFRQIVLDSYPHYYVLDWLLVFIAMLGIVEIGKRIWIFRPLTVLGENSFEMYIIHGIFINYVQNYVYYTENVIGIFLRVLFITLAAALVIKGVKKIIHFQKIYVFCSEEKMCLKFAAVFFSVIFFLLLPEGIANIGIGKLIPADREINMQQDKYREIEYTEIPLLWEFANVKYESSDSNVVYCANGFIFSHEKGTAEVAICIPMGKKAVINVKVE